MTGVSVSCAVQLKQNQRQASTIVALDFSCFGVVKMGREKSGKLVVSTGLLVLSKRTAGRQSQSSVFSQIKTGGQQA